jgi:hypothetical protein
VEIAAPAERIFAILGDLPAYPEWNPLTPRVESTLRPGDPIHLHVRLGGRGLSHRVEVVSANEPPKRLCWRMQLGAPWLLAAERCQELTPLGGGRTRYRNEEVFRGCLTPLVSWLFGSRLRRGFEDVALALKKRAEA